MTTFDESGFSDRVEAGIQPLRGSTQLAEIAGVAPLPGDWADLAHDDRERAARRWAIFWEVLAVLAITALGAALRLMWLDKPAIWGDESATYQRICGSFAELVDNLRGWGFVPLHYEFYYWWRTWLLDHGRLLSPTLMRLPVAICSALMVPAIYSLARQLTGRSAALAVTLITATSAYMLFYAHDAKMYADSWLFCTLWMSAFVWWARKGSVMAWLAWVAAGAIAAGISAPGMALLGVQLVWLIAARHHRWWKSLLFLAGAAVILAGPAYYYSSFIKWGEHIEDQGWGASGLDWVNGYNRTRDGVDLVRFTSTAYLFAWEWPTVDNVDAIDPTALRLCEYSSTAVLVLLMLGIFPWPTRGRYLALAGQPLAMATVDESRGTIWAGLRRFTSARGPVAWWRSLLWLSVWIIVPTYGIYLASMGDAESPTAWWDVARDWLGHPWNAAIAVVAALAAFYCCSISLKGRIVRTLQLIGVLIIPVAMCFALRELLKIRSPGSLWMPRYLGFIWPGVAIAATVLLMRLPGAILRWSAVGLVVAMNLINGIERMAQYTEPPMQLLVSDFYTARESRGATVLVSDFIHGGADPGRERTDSPTGWYYLMLLEKKTGQPGDFWPRSQELRDYPNDTDPASVASLPDLEEGAKRLVIWHVHDEKADPINYSKALSPDWHLVSTKQYHLFQYWNWNALDWLDRVEYERTGH